MTANRQASAGGLMPIHQQERGVRLCFWVNTLSVFPVLALALLSGSMILLVDFLDYARISITTFLGWRILNKIRREKIIGYDYGSGKLQTLGGMSGSTLYVAALLVMAAISVMRLVQPQHLHQTFALAGALGQLLAFSVELWFWARNRRLARLSYSPIMEMQWRASRADALSCLAVFLGLSLTLLFREMSWSIYLDPFFALVFIGYALVSFRPVLREGLNDLLDKTLQEELQLKIDRRLAEQFNGYDGFHGVRSRRSGGRIFIEIALSFLPNMPVGRASATASNLSRAIEGDIPGSEVRIVLMPRK